jgi:hypothetical protein
MGVLSALPLVNALNFCCCLWVVTGGLVGAYMLQQNQAAPITAGDGALVGFLAGIIGAFVMFVVSIPVSFLVAPMERAMVQRSLEMAGNMPPELRRVLENYGQETEMGFLGRLVMRIAGLFMFLIVGSVFSTLGGLLGTALFRKRVSVPPPPPSSI